MEGTKVGEFLQVAIMQGGKEEEARSIVRTVAEKYCCTLYDSHAESARKYDITDLYAEECKYKESPNGVSILMNNECMGYGDIAGAISEMFSNAVLLLYIYDGDYWAYELYHHGEKIDQFDPWPDYFGGASEELIQELKGNAELIAKYFSVDKAEIEKYLVRWADKKHGEKAYEDDEFEYWSDWQMLDFMRKLGYSYEFGEEG
jgi:hypothetical protein